MTYGIDLRMLLHLQDIYTINDVSKYLLQSCSIILQ